jgi:hypothetical protein
MKAMRTIPSVSRSTTASNKNHIKIDFVPSADEVARKVCVNYGNLGSLPGDEVQRWLEAEVELLTELILTGANGGPRARASCKGSAKRIPRMFYPAEHEDGCELLTNLSGRTVANRMPRR